MSSQLLWVAMMGAKGSMWDAPLVTAEPINLQVAREKGKKTTSLLFTVSKWNAVAHISGNHVAVEHGWPDPNDVFPSRIMRMVDYGIKHGGLDCRVVEYASPEGGLLGAVLYLSSGLHTVGCYAMRYEGANKARTYQH